MPTICWRFPGGTGTVGRTRKTPWLSAAVTLNRLVHDEHAAMQLDEEAAARQPGSSRRAERYAFAANRGRAELQSGIEIIDVEIGVVSEHGVKRHAGGEQLQQMLYGVSESADDRLAMTHLGI